MDVDNFLLATIISKHSRENVDRRRNLHSSIRLTSDGDQTGGKKKKQCIFGTGAGFMPMPFLGLFIYLSE